MKNILLPTDFSDNAWNAIFTGLKIHQNQGCHFILLNTYEPKIANVLGSKSKERLGVIYDSLSKNSKQQLKSSVDYLIKNHERPNHRFETISIAGNIEQAINKLVKERNIDLIVMGTKGATGAKEVFMGSNTVKIIKKVKTCATLAVPEEHDFKSLKTVVFPTDFTHSYGKNELTPLLDILNNWNAEIKIFQVADTPLLNNEQNVNKQLLLKRFANYSHSFHEVEMWNNISTATNEFVSQKDADLIAMISYPHTFIEKLTRESVIRKVGFNTKIPLLVMQKVEE